MSFAHKIYGEYFLFHPAISTTPFIVIVTIAAAAFIALAMLEAKRKKLPYKNMIYLIIAGYIGQAVIARFFYYFGPWSANFDVTLAERIVMFLSFWKYTGMVFYGGIIGGILAVWLFCRYKKLNIYKYLDAIAPGAMFLLFIARFGCYTTNCCFGIETNLPWALERFGTTVHPTELYESLAGLSIFIVLTELKFRQAKKKLFDGYVFLWGIILYSIARGLLVEPFRYYDVRYFGFLSGSQAISIVIFAIGGILLYGKYRGSQKPKKQRK